jgi:hypothetical protein
MSSPSRKLKRAGSTRRRIARYVETTEEKAALMGDTLQLDRLISSGGDVWYYVPGLEPDNAESLEADGLIERKPDGSLVINNPRSARVLAWEISINGAAV